MSSILKCHSPPWARAFRKLPRAASKEPACKGPVGEGAKRPMALQELSVLGDVMAVPPNYCSSGSPD